MARVSHTIAHMRCFLLLSACGVFALAGCSGSPDNDLFDMPPGVFEGGPPSSNAVASGGIDAAACAFQGQASVTGTLGGSAFVAKDAIELFESESSKYILEISDYANACGAGAGTHASSGVVSIIYDGSLALASGTYDIAKTAGFSAKHVQYDATCRPSASVAATSGTITFGKLNKCGGTTGTFDLMFGADHVTTSFTASVCSVASAAGGCH
jgi:hypothetical protein